MQIIYPDILFAINFCMDFISLYLSGTFLNLPRKSRCLLFASSFGAALSVFMVLFNGNAMIDMSVGILSAFVICYIAFGGLVVKSDFFRAVTVFYVVSILLGGAITVFYNFLNGLLSEVVVGDGPANQEKGRFFLLAAMICSAFVYGFMNILKGRLTRNNCEMLVSHTGRTVKLHALVDSGNFLRDPFSGTPVIVISYSLAEDILGKVQLKNMVDFKNGCPAKSIRNCTGFRIIPGRSMLESRLLVGFKADKIELLFPEKRGMSKRSIEAVLAVDVDKVHKNFNGADAIVPKSLLI